MLNEKLPYSLLSVSGHKFDGFVRALLPPAGFSPVSSAANVGEAQRLMISTDFDIVVIDSPLPDSSGVEFAVDTAQTTHSGVLLLVRSEIYEQTAARVERYGVLTAAKPITRQSFYQDIKLLAATRERMRRIEIKNASLQSKMDEIRLVNRAKWVLIERLGMSEPQAHRYIEKQAMDLRETKSEIAQSIIKTHEDSEVTGSHD